jgi:hypothetical protein
MYGTPNDHKLNYLGLSTITWTFLSESFTEFPLHNHLFTVSNSTFLKKNCFVITHIAMYASYKNDSKSW